MIETVKKAVLLRVGLDRGTGGALGPIFDDGTFEYMPIPEREPTRERRRYQTLLGQHGRSLADYLPRKLAALHPHIDPDFNTATYGDAAPRKRSQLSRLIPGNILVFYCGLVPFPPIDQPRLFTIGYLYVKQIHVLTASDIKRRRDLRRRFGRTAHFLRKVLDPELVLVEGDPTRSRLFRRALPLGDGSDNLLLDLEGLGYQGSIQRAVGHWVRGEAPLEFLQAWIRKGPRILSNPRSRLFFLPKSSLIRKGERKGDLAIAIDAHPVEAGDWFLIPSNRKGTRLLVLGRINRCSRVADHHQAFSSLFWYFTEGGALVPQALSPATLRQALRSNRIGHQAVIRRLVAWLFSHYRIGSIRI